MTAVKGENNAAGAARRAAATSVGRTRTESVIQDSAGPSEAKVIRARAPPQGQCGTLMCAQTFLTNLQTGGQLGGHDLRGSAGAKQFTHELGRFIDVGYSRRRSSEKGWAN